MPNGRNKNNRVTYFHSMMLVAGSYLALPCVTRDVMFVVLSGVGIDKMTFVANKFAAKFALTAI